MPRPKGLPKTGGRQKGAVEKIRREAILAAQGITPLDYMMGIVRNEQEDKTVRLDAAKAAAPYVHARLQTTTLGPDMEANSPRNPARKQRRWFSDAGLFVAVLTRAALQEPDTDSLVSPVG